MLRDWMDKATLTIIVTSEVAEYMRDSVEDLRFAKYLGEYHLTNEKTGKVDFTMLEFELLCKACFVGVWLMYRTSIAAMRNYKLIKRPGTNDYMFIPRDRMLRKLKMIND